VHVAELAEGLGLLVLVDVGALAVLEQRLLERLAVAQLADEGGDVRPAGELGRADAALAVDELVERLDVDLPVSGAAARGSATAGP
jgi:hypothetical protein